jgi:hypothetical protein
MVGIAHLLPTCNWLAAEDKDSDPQLWHTTRRPGPAEHPKAPQRSPEHDHDPRVSEGPLSDSESEVLDPECREDGENVRQNR